MFSRAKKRTSLIVTTNLPLENWTEVLGSERLTGALLDRLTLRVHIIQANGESDRLKQSNKLASPQSSHKHTGTGKEESPDKHQRKGLIV